MGSFLMILAMNVNIQHQPILNGTDEVKMCNAGYPVLAIKKPDKETIIIK